MTGKPRSGKTFLLNLIAHILYLEQGLNVQGNFPLFGASGKGQYINGAWTGKLHPLYREIQPYDLVQMLIGERCASTEALFLHEVYAWFNSHKSLTDINDFEDTLVFQCGKLNRHIWYDAQLIMRVDGALRKLASARWESERDDDNRQFIYWELDAKISDQDVRTENNFTIPYAAAAAYWNQYDTYSRTFPIGLVELIAKMEKTNPAVLKERVNSQIELLAEYGKKYGLESPRDVSKAACEYALLMLDAPVAHAGLVAIGLKLKLRRS